MVDVAALKIANEKRWSGVRPTRNYISIAKSLVAAKPRYVTVADRTGCPWYFVAIVHEREADQDWDTQLGQGDPLHHVSTHVPAGRGPFETWEDGAVDALVRCPPYAAHNRDWTIGGLLTEWEQYNGLGYAERGLPSPYVWAGTNQYVRGKYTSDGEYNPNVVDQQPGCANLLMAMMALDHSIVVGDAIAIVPMPAGSIVESEVVPEPAPPTPTITSSAPVSSAAALISYISSYFKKRPA
jgi:lysozyme family protein